MLKYYAVKTLIPTWYDRRTYEVKVFNENNELLLHTWHIGESSVQMEIKIWEERGHTRKDELFYNHKLAPEGYRSPNK